MAEAVTVVAARVELQVALAETAELPLRSDFGVWVNAALNASAAKAPPGVCVTIRIVDSAESSELNAGYRDISKPTNVLAFPASTPVVPDLSEDEAELGDLVICHEIVIREAREQGKSPEAHLAHLVVHGTLHLVGYDHQNDSQAKTMEELETKVMQTMGFADPYAVQ